MGSVVVGVVCIERVGFVLVEARDGDREYAAGPQLVQVGETDCGEGVE
ncbi:hypothetical protein ACWCRF_35750 [Streptomyces sp. NPDC002405]